MDVGDSCPNAQTVDEEELIEGSVRILFRAAESKEKCNSSRNRRIPREFTKPRMKPDYEKELERTASQDSKMRQKYGYDTDDLITREETE